LKILREAKFDTSGMVSFFGRLQSASRAYTESVPAFLRSHPLTTERIADIQSRTQDYRYKQRADSLDFHLLRARVRVLQDASSQGLDEARVVFENQLLQRTPLQIAAGKYGLAMIALRQGAYPKALTLLQESRTAAGANVASPVYASLSIDIRRAAHQDAEAIREADAARNQFPLSRGLARQYAEALIAAGRHDDAIKYLRDQVQLYRQDARLQEMLAQSYAAQGKLALQHLALAEAHAIDGTLPAALEQLTIARTAPDASFYDQAQIDARERELRVKLREELKELKERR
jgi:predicted Zn-dependent protease